MSNSNAYWAAQVAIPADYFWKHHGAPRKGEYGGQCYQVTCRNSHAEWYNKGSGRYYCDECARAINEMCLDEGMPKLCELHI